MTIWEFLWTVNENGEATINTFGWIVVVAIVLALTIVLSGSIIWWLTKRFVWPKIEELFAKIDDHSNRIRNLEEDARALAKSDEDIVDNQKKQLDLSKEMVHYSNSLVENMKTTCSNFQELNNVLTEKVSSLERQLYDLLKEHQQRHSGEKITYTKRKSC